MIIDHVALWVEDLEKMVFFYTKHFGATAGKLYTNEEKGFQSYFLTFESGGRLELMSRTDIVKKHEDALLGWAHIAISVGSKEKVDSLTDELCRKGYCHVDGPRMTGDGYYESVVLDPEGNHIELTV
ncbi:MAG: VOC family protein [Bacillota bacterium]